MQTTVVVEAAAPWGMQGVIETTMLQSAKASAETFLRHCERLARGGQMKTEGPTLKGVCDTVSPGH